MSVGWLAAFGQVPHVAADLGPNMAEAVNPFGKTARAQSASPVSRTNFHDGTLRLGEERRGKMIFFHTPASWPEVIAGNKSAAEATLSDLALVIGDGVASPGDVVCAVFGGRVVSAIEIDEPSRQEARGRRSGRPSIAWGHLVGQEAPVSRGGHQLATGYEAGELPAPESTRPGAARGRARRAATSAPSHPTVRLSADARREAVLRAAIVAFSRGGLAGTSTEDIARLAGISQPYLFRLFGNKKDLFLAVVQRAFDRAQSTLVDAAGDRTGEEAMAAMDDACRTLVEDRTLLLAQVQAYAACGDDDVRRVTRSCFGKMWQAVAKATRFDDRRLADFFGHAFQLTMAAAMDFTALTGLPGEGAQGFR